MEITRQGDLGTPERHSRNELVKKNVNGLLIASVRKISPIDYYYNRGEITTTQLSAGNLLYKYYIICQGGHNCEPKERIDGGNKQYEDTEKQVHARLKLNKGINTVKRHSEYFEVIDKVVIDEKFVSDIVGHWYTRKKMKQNLREALDMLAKCYYIP